MLADGGVASSMDTTRTLGERLAIGGQLAVLGLGMVFLILIILWVILEVFKIIFYKPVSAKKEISSPVPTAVPETVEPEIQEDDNSDELVAAISAAVAAYLSDEAAAKNTPVSGFRVVSFKKVRR